MLRMKKLSIEIDGKVFTANLLEKDAPNTCSFILKNLPLEGELIHCSWSGEGAFSYFKMSDQGPLENQSIYGSAGEIFYYPPQNELMLIYGKAHFRFRDGELAANLFARIDDLHLADFIETVSRLQREGVKSITVKQIE